MSSKRSDLSRILSSTGVYAMASLARRGLSLMLLPIYTRYIEPQDYGVLELLNAFSAVAFALLTMGMPSAIQKTYHRDCKTDAQRARVFPTALGIDLPVLLAGSGLLIAAAAPISRWLLATDSHADLYQLVVAAGVLTAIVSVTLASLRAREQAVAFSILSLFQFLAAISLNIVFVVVYDLGIRGILWGNLIAVALALPVSLWVASRRVTWKLDKRLVRPLAAFGILVVPSLLSAWVMDLSDRYVLRLYSSFDEIAIYGVGYKIGMVLHLAVVWPFQLAWPAFSFSISERPEHEQTYARALTYLVLVLVGLGLALSIASRVIVTGGLIGASYREAYVVVPLVALAYAFNGVQYCVSPGVHLAGKTRLLPMIAVVAALGNLALNFLLIPQWGMMGAAWATTIAFFALALGTAAIGQRYYPVQYEYGRLARLVAVGVAIYLIAIRVEPSTEPFSVAWHGFMALAAFPLSLLAMGFFRREERDRVMAIFRRYDPRS
jgi:O-antigen/teichoic acid export membrane protein